MKKIYGIILEIQSYRKEKDIYELYLFDYCVYHLFTWHLFYVSVRKNSYKRE